MLLYYTVAQKGIYSFLNFDERENFKNITENLKARILKCDLINVLAPLPKENQYIYRPCYSLMVRCLEGIISDHIPSRYLHLY